MNTSVEIRSGRFTVIDEEENQQAPVHVSSSSHHLDPHHHHDVYRETSPSSHPHESSASPSSYDQQTYQSHFPDGTSYTLTSASPSHDPRTSSTSSSDSSSYHPSAPHISPPSDLSSPPSMSSTGSSSYEPSPANAEAESSPLSAATMRRSGRFTVIDDEGEQSGDYDRVSSEGSATQAEEEGYREMMRRNEHSDDPELVRGGEERRREVSGGDVEVGYEAMPEQSMDNAQRAAYEQSMYAQQQYNPQSYDLQQPQPGQVYEEQQAYDQQAVYSQPAYADQQPSYAEPHVTYEDAQYDESGQPLHAQYDARTSSYEEQSSPSPGVYDEHGMSQSGMDFESIASEYGPLNLLSMLYSQVRKLIEENQGLHMENESLRAENYELRTALHYQAAEHSAQHTPQVQSNSTSGQSSPYSSPNPLQRSLSVGPDPSQTPPPSQPVRAATGIPKRPSPLHTQEEERKHERREEARVPEEGEMADGRATLSSPEPLQSPSASSTSSTSSLSSSAPRPASSRISPSARASGAGPSTSSAAVKTKRKSALKSGDVSPNKPTSSPPTAILRKSSLTSSKTPSFNPLALSSTAKKGSPSITPRKKAPAKKDEQKGGFFAGLGGDLLDQFVNQAVSGLCTKGGKTANGVEGKSGGGSKGHTDAVDVLAASLHLKGKEGQERKEEHKEGGKGNVPTSSSHPHLNAFDDLQPLSNLSPLPTPSFGVGAVKKDMDHMFL